MKMIGITCNGCGRTLLDSGEKCIHCDHRHAPDQLNAAKWHRLDRITIFERNKKECGSNAPVDKVAELAVLELAVYSSDSGPGSFLTLPFPKRWEVPASKSRPAL